MGKPRKESFEVGLEWGGVEEQAMKSSGRHTSQAEINSWNDKDGLGVLKGQKGW